MSNAEAVTDSTFEEMVINSDLPVLVDFWAEWCRPCKMIAPAIDEVAVEYDGKLKVMKVDVDNNPNSAAKYGVRSIPALLLFKDGSVANMIVGAVPASQIKDMVEKAL